ncbi:helix-turn-helix transcriptional regulator [Streptomyces sp. NBC_00264]|uniref:helix-turn-helix domain-containing protein n=1 Tax=unclassified Streptomyces TaxID=2593676 RepID=UPI002257B199|nr:MULTISPECIES: helix-turn-helix transcriptional regulator [unclassified Streptomyces]MCX5161163.1 helix-turn-helix transcriptional regulator [Streptomyces sp. NBC_00305]MCX5219686.1 helix-turn-helix transcriptional regulator [Streptomyces sp. NBC_00264]WSG51690.1 helix-turn-helix transcriptional regulator [Streptomyces sp. NBC_01732]
MARAENKEMASPTARLVAEVARTMRGSRGWTQEQLGEEIGYSAAAVSAMETCAQPASDDMLAALERVLGDSSRVFEAARKYIRMEKYPDEFKAYVPLEQAAVRIELYAMDFVHGLFQTEAYARALISGGYPPLPDARVTELVEARMARQSLFDRDPMALIQLVLEESVLTRVFGDKQIMREQMRHLTKCARRRNVTLQVLPSDPGPGGEYAGGHGSLNVLETSDHQHLAYVEVQEESWLLSDPAKVSRYAQRCAKIRAQALSTRESLDYIERLAGDQQ